MQISSAQPPTAAPSPSAALSWLSPALAAPHLELVFSLARIPWVRDFLLRTDTRGDVATLCGPLQLAHGWGADARVHVRDAGRCFAGALDVDAALRVAAVPALACGSLTVGVAVQETLASSGAPGRVSVGRFVRDDANGAVFVLAHNRASAATEVLFVYHESAMRSSRYYLRFRADAFRDAMSRHAEAFAVADLSAALIYCTLQSETRDCPMCRSPVRVLCNCNLAFIPPKHSVDFAPLRANMQAMMGRFEGTGVGELYVGGESVLGHSSSKVQVLPSSDANVVHRLAMLGTQQLMSSASEAPPPPSIMMGEERAFCGGQGDSGVAGTEVKEINYVQSLESIIQESLTPQLGEPQSTQLGEPQPPAPPPLPPPPVAPLVASFLRPTPHPAPHLSPVSEINCGGSENEPKWDGNGVGGGVEVAHSPTTSQGSSASEKPRVPRRGSRRPVSEEVLRERERRKQIRIFKNRAAAARSNARRKLQNDALKGALAEVRGRALQLRDRHMALREENLKLKMALLM